MEVIYLLIPLSLAFITVAIYVIYLAIKSDQFDDMEGPAHRILMDDRSQRRHDLAARDALSRPPTAAHNTTESPAKQATESSSTTPKSGHHD
ncbi:MAG: cbb3-type cytochrome oxidase assembly protein CcoS [Paraperlucidibaca sp.]